MLPVGCAGRHEAPPLPTLFPDAGTVRGEGCRRQSRGNFCAQTRHGERQLVAATWRLAEPEWNRRWQALCVLDAQFATLDAQHAICRVAKLENVAGHALDCEILVHRADFLCRRFEHDLVIGGVGDRAARGDRGQPRTTARTQYAIDRVAMQIRRTRAAPRRVALGEHAQDLAERLDWKISEWLRATNQFEQLLFVPLAAGDFGDDLLCEHIERVALYVQRIELAAAHRVEQGRAFDQIVARQRKQPALGQAIDRVVGAADALQEGRDRTRRGNLADQVDVTDIDAEFERRGCDQRLQFAALEALLGSEALLAREAAVVRGHRVLAEQFGQMPRQPFGHTSRVDENESRAMRLDQFGKTRVDQLPDIAGHHCRQRRGRQFERKVARARVADVDEVAASRLPLLRRLRCRGRGLG